MARWETIRAILALAVQKGYKVHQLDVKSASLHGELTKTVFVDQPQGFEKPGEEVYKLRKSLYGLKQAPRAWYSRIERYFTKAGFSKCPYELTLFCKKDERGIMIIVSLYVDDLIVTGNNDKAMEKFKDAMKKEFDMSDLEEMRYFLGVEIIQKPLGIFISQRKYAREILERFKLDQYNHVKNPMVPGVKLVKEDGSEKADARVYKQMVGCLIYLAATRPDLMYVISLVSRFMESPTDQQMQAVKRIFRYVKGTLDWGIWYMCEGNEELVAFSDSDYVGDLDSRKSTSGYACFLSDGAISWSSKRQSIVTLSTTKAEFVSATSCACQVVWLRNVLHNIGHT